MSCNQLYVIFDSYVDGLIREYERTEGFYFFVADLVIESSISCYEYFTIFFIFSTSTACKFLNSVNTLDKHGLHSCENCIGCENWKQINPSTHCN